MWLTKLFVRRPTLVFVMVALVAIAGSISTATIVQQQFPNIDFPTIGIRASYPGGSTTEIRDAIVRPIEDAIAGSPDLDHINTTIQQGQVAISAVFTLSSDLTTDLVQVQRRLLVARAQLPSDMPAPTVGTFDPAEATVVTLGANSATLAPQTLSAIVNNDIVPAIEQVDGISNVNVSGAVTPSIEVNVDPRLLSASGFTLNDIVSTIATNNNRLPGGIVYGTNRETSIDVRGDVQTPDSVAKLLVNTASQFNTALGNASYATPPLLPSSPSSAFTTTAAQSAAVTATQAPAATATQAPAVAASRAPAVRATQGRAVGATAAPVSASTGAASQLTGPQSPNLNQWSVSPRLFHIADIAAVIDGYWPPRTYSYVGYIPTITLNVQKTAGASEVAASRNVLAALPVLRRQFPAVNLQVLNVQATYTEQQIQGVFRTLIEAIIITAIVMLFFVRSWRNALVVLIAIPTSLGVTITLMKLLNFTIDTVSLLAMTLVIGILVDDSIVVIENVKRHYDAGEDPQTAAIQGRSQIAAAAVVITLVDVVVFLPIAFLPGTVGRFLSEFGLVVVVATLTSLFVSFTVTPALAGNWSLLERWTPPRIIDGFTNAFENLRWWYAKRALPWALRRPKLIVTACALLTLAALSLIPLGVVGFEFIPAVDRGEVFIQVTYPTGTPLDTVNATIVRIAKRIATIPSVDNETAIAGAMSSNFGDLVNLGSLGQIHVFLKTPPTHPTDYWAQYFGRIARRLAPAARIVSIPATSTGGGNSQPIDYIVTAVNDNPDPYAVRVLDILRSTPGATNVNSSAEQVAPQVDVQFDRERARAVDVNIGQAASSIRAAYGGTLATQFDTVRGTKYVQVLYPREFQTGLRMLAEIPLRANNGALVHLNDVAHFVNHPSPPLITRVNRQTVVHVSANVAPGVALSSVQRAFQKRLAVLHLPSTVSVVPNAGGTQQNLSDTVRGMAAALALSSLLVYLLMVALYDSYRLPFIIMFSVPVAFVGTLGLLALTHQTLNLFSLIGIVLLVGLASKNGILLVDFANHKVEGGMDRVNAILQSALERFRPIIMTTVAMIAGMLPIALALDPGSSTRQGLGIAVIGGLTSSLVLTLVLVPVIFMWIGPEPRRARASDGMSLKPSELPVAQGVV